MIDNWEVQSRIRLHVCVPNIVEFDRFQQFIIYTVVLYCFWMHFNCLSNDKILDWSKLKASADNINVTEN